MPVDISGWPTKSDAMQRLGVRLTQLNNLIKQRKLEVRLENRQGMPPLGRINPEDLEREAERRKGQPTAVHVMPKGTNTPARKPKAEETTADSRSAFAKLIDEMVCAKMLEDRDVLRLDEAAMVSGYGQGILEQAIAMGKLPAKRAGRHGSIVVRRADLAGLWELI